VSGRIAQDVGACMKSLASRHQVIAITHLPQIAGFADSHFVVEKVEAKGRAVTGIRAITGDERVHEVAKLLSGADVTKSALASAKELIAVSTR
jgi:DNA repair protein RecN (Recombination protein N)